MCQTLEGNAGCCKCMPYRDFNAICPPITAGILFLMIFITLWLWPFFPLGALAMGIFGFTAWFMFLGSCCCTFSPCGLVTTAVFGMIAALSALILSVRMRKDTNFDFDVWCTSDEYYYNVYNDDDPWTASQCNKVRDAFATSYLVSAFVWLIASIHLIVFLAAVYPKKFADKVKKEGENKEEAAADKLGTIEAGTMPPQAFVASNGQVMMMMPTPVVTQPMQVAPMVRAMPTDDPTETSATVSGSLHNSSSTGEKKKKKKKYYDKYGNEVKRVKKYDEDGNLIKQTYYDKDGNPIKSSKKKKKKSKKKTKKPAEESESEYSESDYTDTDDNGGGNGAPSGSLLKSSKQNDEEDFEW